MKDQQTVQQFIELRGRGINFAKIAQQRGVARSTLVNWSREHQQHLISLVKQVLKSHASKPRFSSDRLQIENHTDFGQFRTDSTINYPSAIGSATTDQPSSQKLPHLCLRSAP